MTKTNLRNNPGENSSQFSTLTTNRQLHLRHQPDITPTHDACWVTAALIEICTTVLR